MAPTYLQVWKTPAATPLSSGAAERYRPWLEAMPTAPYGTPTDPALAESVNPQFGLASYAWKTIAANGTTFNGYLMSFESVTCLPEAGNFPSALGHGEKATGKIILDVPTPTGILVHKQGFMTAGWEWQYPAK